ncbi:hypothetical protein BT69DRAFT_1281116, partial [Atractiella rhizophila]
RPVTPPSSWVGMAVSHVPGAVYRTDVGEGDSYAHPSISSIQPSSGTTLVQSSDSSELPMWGRKDSSSQIQSIPTWVPPDPVSSHSHLYPAWGRRESSSQGHSSGSQPQSNSQTDSFYGSTGRKLPSIQTHRSSMESFRFPPAASLHSAPYQKLKNAGPATRTSEHPEVGAWQIGEDNDGPGEGNDLEELTRDHDVVWSGVRMEKKPTLKVQNVTPIPTPGMAPSESKEDLIPCAP